MRRSKIVATLGPASESTQQIEKLVKAGADLFRLNFSHGSPSEYKAVVSRVRDVSRRMKRAVGILGDIQGPKVRVGSLAGGAMDLKKGSTVRFAEAKGSDKIGVIPVPHDLSGLEVGERVLLRDGLIVLRVQSVSGRRIICRVIDGGTVTKGSGVSAPHIGFGKSAITKKDRADIKLAVELDIDWLGVSFVGGPSDLVAARGAAERAGKRLSLVAKLERSGAVDKIDEILDEADAVMVARGDLALEVPLEKVPIMQKNIIRMARERGIPSIVATQMLESMVSESRPTRAEASDVANAIFDGADAMMLSEETAIGDLPVAAVRTMSAIAKEAEESGLARLEYTETVVDGVLGAIARAVQAASEYSCARAIVIFTLSGRTARAISAMRPQLPIFALTPVVGTYRAMSLFWGVKPILIPQARSTDHMLKIGEEALIGGRHLGKGSTVIAVSGSVTVGGATNMIKINRLG